MTKDALFSIESVLESCVERERMSIRLYDRAFQVVLNPASRRVLQALRQEEVTHERLLTEALETRRPELIGNRPLSDESGPFAPSQEKFLEKTSTPTDVLLYAMAHEEKSVEYFSRYVDAFRGTPLGDLFERLVREEESHWQKLKRQYRKFQGKGFKSTE